MFKEILQYFVIFRHALTELCKIFVYIKLLSFCMAELLYLKNIIIWLLSLLISFSPGFIVFHI